MSISEWTAAAKKAFKEFDNTGDGKLTAEDFINIRQTPFAQAIGEKAFKRMQTQLDLNKDGTISEDEFVQAYIVSMKVDEEESESTTSSSYSTPPDWTSAAVKAFKEFDTTGDGKITVEDFVQAGQNSFAQTIGEKAFKRMQNQFDPNKDGVLTEEEFVAAYIESMKVKDAEAWLRTQKHG